MLVYLYYINMRNSQKPVQILLKNGQLYPKQLELNLPKHEDSTERQTFDFSIKIMKSKGSDTNFLGTRKYIFGIKELEEYQTDFLEEGDQEVITWIQQPGTFHLFCVNYPKLQCIIVAKFLEEDTEEEPGRLSNTRISLNLQAVEEQRQEKQQQIKEDLKIYSVQKIQNRKQVTGIASDTKQKQQWLQQQDKQFIESPFGTPKKAEIDDYDRILSSQKLSEENLQNRYLRYFQQQFKLWRNFFDSNEEPSHLEQQSPEIGWVREKPKSERRKNSGHNIKQQRNEENWSKRENFSPNQLFFTQSCGSPSYNENLSDQDKSVGSYLYSHQGTHDCADEELYGKARTMKKTNSEYRLAVQDIFEQKQTLPETEKKKKPSNQIKSLLQWIDNWCENEENPQTIEIPIKDDQYLVNQWLTHLKNRYKLAKFICQ